MKANWSILSGVVHREPRRIVSPSGIVHCQFLLEHHSENIEAGCNRRVWCWMPVVMSVPVPQEMPEFIIVGARLRVYGFLCCHKGRNGLHRIVLHAKNIELIESGDINGTLFPSS
ncbi:Primosomal replication protein N [Candidatus Erwinia haradaeae]|uniref:Primosomal replication protein N n=1 Tax=Candidatus Erwinia haradaeae TaxID=1922217 RepID=A0A451DDC6_9GAMM|nr:primosomal replication protein N [Candidatus Erwinia haradaeae]VFP84413.1 Primosomal replication protein N [Candidatus Erwinia haradaeae]